MEYVSSDTNVWIDFLTIDRLNLPFLLPYVYIMYDESIENELLSPPNFQSRLLQCGLKGVDITEEEFLLAEQYGSRFAKLSIPDRIALSIAKRRNITLLTGDMALRKAAIEESVQLIGTIGILDQLFEGHFIEKCEYLYCLTEL